jgi:hypothetical protein
MIELSLGRHPRDSTGSRCSLTTRVPAHERRAPGANVANLPSRSAKLRASRSRRGARVTCPDFGRYLRNSERCNVGAYARTMSSRAARSRSAPDATTRAWVDSAA